MAKHFKKLAVLAVAGTLSLPYYATAGATVVPLQGPSTLR